MGPPKHAATAIAGYPIRCRRHSIGQYKIASVEYLQVDSRRPLRLQPGHQGSFPWQRWSSREWRRRCQRYDHTSVGAVISY